MRVRRIAADEWEGWREFRLAMLSDAPYAFGSTAAEMSRRPEQEWRERVGALAGSAETTYVLAEEDGVWLSGAGGYVEHGVPNVFGVWTRPEARGRGYADACVRAIVDWARAAGHTEIRLWATDSNDAARRVYDRIGFVPLGNSQPLPSDQTLTESEYVLRLG